jgi:glycosyltransferase involved in cell wall biosynthesis
MKIVNVSTLRLNDSHNYYGGAIGNIGYNLLASLARRPDLEVVSFTLGTDFSSSPPSDLTLIEVDSYREAADRLDEISMSRDDVYTHLYFHEPEYTPLSATIAERPQPFVIGMCEPPHPRYRDELSGVERLPLVRWVGKHLLYMPRFRRTLERCDTLVAVNEYAREYYGEYIDESDIEVAPYAVDRDRFGYEPLPEEPRILIVSRLIKRRDIDTLVQALATVAAEESDVTVDVVGEGPRRDTLESIAEANGVRSRITFHGNVDPDELRDRYRECFVFCHLSEADGWNQPALEAMSTGRPVVTVDAPHNSMIRDGENGYLIPFGDEDVLADRLLTLFDSPERAAEMGRAGRELVEERYDWERVAAEYERVFREAR